MSIKKKDYIIVILTTTLIMACNYNKLEQSKKNTILNKKIDNYSNLGVVYDAEYLRNLLKDREKDSPKDYELVGIVFKNIVEKEFTLQVLYFSVTKSNAFCSEQINKTTEGEKYYASILHSNIEAITEPQNIIKQKSNLKFWDIMNSSKNSHLNPFIFFSKNELELLLSGEGVTSITFSGAQVNYDIGVRNYAKHAVDIDNNTEYPTLKAESNFKTGNSNKYFPNVVIGLPCPPMWGDDYDYFDKKEEKDADEKEDKGVEKKDEKNADGKEDKGVDKKDEKGEDE